MCIILNIHTHTSNTSYAIYMAKEIDPVIELISVFQ